MAAHCAAIGLLPMIEFSPQQIKIIERLFAVGFRHVVIPPYENALCMRKGECVAVMTPVMNGGLKLLAPSAYVVDGNFSVHLKRASGDVFVWKKTELSATPERVRELESFRKELDEILALPPAQ
ncbi:MAG TPA: hypothetical protein VK525_07815 [Candidatus Saccharimonadales bacterium]|nr:hypothetical protein [Candidatus Saccharimonadales bacterium]